MKRLLAIAIALWCASTALAQGTQHDRITLSAGAYINQAFTAGGNTTAGHLVKLNTSGQVVEVTTSDTFGVIGVVQTTASSGSTVYVAIGPGQVPTVVDGACTTGNQLEISSSTNGVAHCTPSSPSQQDIGTSLSTIGSAGNITAQLSSGSGGGGGGGGGSVGSVFGRTGDVAAQSGDYSFSQISGTITPSTQFPSFNAGTVLANCTASSAPPSACLITGAMLPNPTATTLGGIRSFAGNTHQWINSISLSGVPASSQPSFSDLAGTLAPGQCPVATSSAFGCVEGIAQVANQFVQYIDNSGVPHLAQPAYSGISGTPTLYNQTLLAGGSALAQEPKFNFIQGTNITISCVDNSGSTRTDCTFTASNSASTAFSGLTAATNSNTGNFIVSGGNWDFSGGTWKAPSSGSYAPTTSAVFGYDSTNNIYVFGQNGSTLTLPVTKGSASHNFLTSYTQGTGLFTAAQPSFGDLSSSLNCSQTPALTGDTTTSAGSCATTTAKVNGVSYGSGPGTNTVAVVTGSNATTYEQVPNAALANPSTTVTAGTNLTGGGTATLGSSVTLNLSDTPNLTSSGVFKFNSDTGVSRDSAGVVDFGNGTAGDFSATTKAAGAYYGPGGSGTNPTAGAGVHSAWTFGESAGTAPTCQAGIDIVWSSYNGVNGGTPGLYHCDNGGTLVKFGQTTVNLSSGTVTGTLQTANGAPLTAQTTSLGGSAIAAGACSTQAVTVTGANTNMVPIVSPETDPGAAFYYKARISATNQVTVAVCTNLAGGGTPNASVYDIRVIQ